MLSFAVQGSGRGFHMCSPPAHITLTPNSPSDLCSLLPTLDRVPPTFTSPLPLQLPLSPPYLSPLPSISISKSSISTLLPPFTAMALSRIVGPTPKNQ